MQGDRHDVRLILRELDPEGVELRKARRRRRRMYFARGPNFVWHFDGYDKLKPYGLCISGGICGFSRHLLWLNVYHTNSDPRVIGGYFLEAVKSSGGCPRIVRGATVEQRTLMCGHSSCFFVDIAATLKYAELTFLEQVHLTNVLRVSGAF